MSFMIGRNFFSVALLVILSIFTPFLGEVATRVRQSDEVNDGIFCSMMLHEVNTVFCNHENMAAEQALP